MLFLFRIVINIEVCMKNIKNLILLVVELSNGYSYISGKIRKGKYKIKIKREVIIIRAFCLI